jgi:phosphotransacetylase
LQRGAEVNEIVNLAVLAALDALEHQHPLRPTP